MFPSATQEVPHPNNTLALFPNSTLTTYFKCLISADLTSENGTASHMSFTEWLWTCFWFESHLYSLSKVVSNAYKITWPYMHTAFSGFPNVWHTSTHTTIPRAPLAFGSQRRTFCCCCLRLKPHSITTPCLFAVPSTATAISHTILWMKICDFQGRSHTNDELRNWRVSPPTGWFGRQSNELHIVQIKILTSHSGLCTQYKSQCPNSKPVNTTLFYRKST